MPKISASAYVHETARIAEGAVVMEGAWIGPNVQIAAGTTVEHGAVIGYRGSGAQDVVIGRDCLIATNSTIYHSVRLGDRVKIRHNAVVRENVVIGDETSIGTGATVEPQTTIGRFCSFHCRVHITDFSAIGDYVFIGPGFVSMSDINLDYRRPRLHQPYKGVTIGSGARIGGAVVALPGTVVGAETTVGAGAHISGELRARTVYVGAPARAIRRIRPDEQLPPS